MHLVILLVPVQLVVLLWLINTIKLCVESTLSTTFSSAQLKKIHKHACCIYPPKNIVQWRELWSVQLFCGLSRCRLLFSIFFFPHLSLGWLYFIFHESALHGIFFVCKVYSLVVYTIYDKQEFLKITSKITAFSVLCGVYLFLTLSHLLNAECVESQSTSGLTNDWWMSYVGWFIRLLASKCPPFVWHLKNIICDMIYNFRWNELKLNNKHEM